MRRSLALSVLIAAVGLAAVAGGARAQDEEPKVVRIDTLNVRDTLYHLSGGGGNALALIDEINGGIVLVDAMPPGWSQAVLDAVALVTHLPVTTIINSHAHAGDASGNAEFEDVTQIVAHENTGARLEGFAEPDAPGLPTTTFAERFSLLEDLDRIELYYFGPAHTDGDIVAVFPAKGVAYLGDLFPAKRVPAIDAASGGSYLAYPDTLARAAAAIEGVERAITGRTPPPSTYAGRGRRDRREPWTTWQDFVEYAEFTREFVGAAEAAFEAGRSAAEAAASLTLAERYAAYDMQRAEAVIEAIYAELAAR